MTVTSRRASLYLRAAIGHSRRWRYASAGNVAIIFALSLLPLVAVLGIAVDYYRGLSYKSRLDGAADSAALAAIATAQAYISNNSSSQTDPALTNNAIAAGQKQAIRVFSVNAAAAQIVVPTTPSVSLARSGQTFTSTVSYSGTTATSFGKVVGVQNLNIGGSSTSSLTMGRYLDFYLLLDVSGSMGIPTTDAGQTQLAAINKDDQSDYPTGCVFACHFDGYQGYALSRSYHIALRVDSVGSAIQALLQTAKQTMTLKNQYRVGLYPFIVRTKVAAPLSSNFTTANQVAGNLGSYLDAGDCTDNTSNSGNGGRGCGGTHFEYFAADMVNPAMTGNPAMPRTGGDGSRSTTPKPFIFLVTDGADNNQIYNPWTGSQPQLPGTAFSTYCTTQKAAGFTIAVLYIPYVPIQNPNPDFAGNEDGMVNAIVPSIPGVLKNCASPSFFFTANSPQDITNAMQAMFAQALQAARLTN